MSILLTLYTICLPLVIAFTHPGYTMNENCKGEMKNNQKAGHWKCYYDDGKLMQEGDYVSDKKEGIWKLYHANGILAGEGPYVNDAEKGKWKFYDDNGKLIMEQEY